MAQQTKAFMQGVDSYNPDENPDVLCPYKKKENETLSYKNKRADWYSGFYNERIRQKCEESLNNYNKSWNFHNGRTMK